MKGIWMVSMVAVVGAGCGQVQGLPWDKNHDGIVAQCEGLDRFFCGLTPNCQGQELACLAICLDDGKGGCLPCPSDFECVPKQPIACSQLSNQQCTNDPRCELFTVQTGSNIRIPEDQPLNITHCREKQSGCGAVPVNSCASIPGCEVQQVTVCSGSAGAQEDRAIAPPICAQDARPSDPALAPAQDAGTPCNDGCTSVSICVNKPVISTCEQRDVASCTQRPECELVNGPVCEIACIQGSSCPPCATPAPTCATKTKNHCQNLLTNECSASVGCKLESPVCTAECRDDGKGGCAPCFAAQICVPL